MGRFRRYDRRPPERRTRINEHIRARMVRTIGPDGEQLGILPTKEALRVAEEAGFDLVEVASNVDPPVCRVMDYGKFVFEKKKKTRKSKAHASELKEIKLRPKIGNHDFQFKSNHVERFLKDGNKVKCVIMFRGREMDFTDKGKDLLMRLAKVHEEYSAIEREPRLEGRNMIMIMAPSKTGKKGMKENAKNENP
ncbi:MAG: translation initiation factor IF-3 [bacterium]